MKGFSKDNTTHQFISVLLNHLYTCVAMLMIMFAFFAWSIGVTPAQEIISVITMLFYICVLYVKAGEIAGHDIKSYSAVKPDIRKPILWGIAIIVITYILYAMYALIAKDGSGAPVWAKAVISLIFNTWTMPYMGIMGAARGLVMPYSHIFWIIVPFLGLIPGYIAGKNKIYFSDWMRKVMYKKEK